MTASDDPGPYLRDLLERFRPLREGKVQQSLPGMDRTDPDTFAIAVATADGQVWSEGDDRHPFSLQSISKPFLYGMALDQLGRECVHRKVAVEPTGEAFNSLTELEEDHLPYNPMINSGAIAISALLHHDAPDESRDRMMAMFGEYLGRRAEVHEAVKGRELLGAHRNRAIAHLLRHFEVIGDDIDGAIRLYAWQCAVMLDVRELALMAATLANGGVQPVTGRRALQRRHVRDVLTLMFTCGMYDTSGTWAYHVGLPAKSGVSGGILAVVPGRMGLAVFSPRLDGHGHSVRGIQVFKAWAVDWGLGVLGGCEDSERSAHPVPDPASAKSAN
ncbi:glutaminase A [Ramlibacter henchirensis]|uniref:Glutaminase n=1 Tax=Ramlibacter henchirensis TaxID=204072 RepID=A0A4Z0CAQ1_9BURK|nr:glutaminase A [Ramlibacter henchirensis]TFZ07205.1 glutaminase A [Ramlibacter henchirensis]